MIFQVHEDIRLYMCTCVGISVIVVFRAVYVILYMARTLFYMVYSILFWFVIMSRWRHMVE